MCGHDGYVVVWLPKGTKLSEEQCERIREKLQAALNELLPQGDRT